MLGRTRCTLKLLADRYTVRASATSGTLLAHSFRLPGNKGGCLQRDVLLDELPIPITSDEDALLSSGATLEKLLPVRWLLKDCEKADPLAVKKLLNKLSC
jgi:hypothetical protein